MYGGRNKDREYAILCHFGEHPAQITRPFVYLVTLKQKIYV
jgi:hypothetical protein